MSNEIDQIRRLLDELEQQTQSGSSDEQPPIWHDGEISQLLGDVVDYLQPLLTPYQAAFYWHLLRHSLLKGSGLVRVSTRGLGRGVVKSARSETVSQGQVKELLSGLESVGAIRKEAEPNRDGTLYRVLAPEQIEASRRFREEKQSIFESPAATESQADYYNVRENRLKIYERDGYVCYYCSKQLTQATATLDHIIAVSAGGDNSLENLITSCLACNSRKNRRPVGDFLAEDGAGGV
jgi:HNH endonuclease